MELLTPFPLSCTTPSIGMAVALDLIVRGVLSIDCDGRIWRHAFKNRTAWKAAKPRRAENVGGKGYLRLTLTKPDGGLVKIMAHRVVWAMAHGTIPPDDLQINHEDLNKQNNKPSNLTICTGNENITHSYANGRTIPWSKNRIEWRPGRPVLSRDTVLAIRFARHSGQSLKQIARRFDLSVSHTHRLASHGRSEDVERA